MRKAKSFVEKTAYVQLSPNNQGHPLSETCITCLNEISGSKDTKGEISYEKLERSQTPEVKLPYTWQVFLILFQSCLREFTLHLNDI